MTTLTAANEITRKHTAFGSFTELNDAMGRGYVPTVHRKRQHSLVSLLAERGHRMFIIG